jgi:hypothetical protein
MDDACMFCWSPEARAVHNVLLHCQVPVHDLQTCAAAAAAAAGLKEAMHPAHST